MNDPGLVIDGGPSAVDRRAGRDVRDREAGSQYDAPGWGAPVLPPPAGAAVAPGRFTLIWPPPLLVELVPGPRANHQTAARINRTTRTPRMTPRLLPPPRSTTTVSS